MQHHDTGQKRTRYRHTYQQCTAYTKGCDNHDHDENNARQYVVLEVTEHGFDLFRFVLLKRHFYRVWPERLLFGDQIANSLIGFNDICTNAFRDFQCQCRLAINPCIAVGIFKGAADGCYILKGNNCITLYFYRHRHDVCYVFNNSWYFKHHAPGTGVNRTCSNQQVVVGNKGKQFIEADVVGFHDYRIYNDL